MKLVEYRNKKKFPDRSPVVFALTIAIRYTYRMDSRRKPLTEHQLGDTENQVHDSSYTPLDSAESKDLQKFMQQKLGKMPKDTQTILRLRSDGRTFAEIAAFVGQPESTVRRKYRDAMNQLMAVQPR